jgi:serine/threonine protein kinase
MNRYLVQEQLGDGTFGTVFRAIRRVDNNEVSQMLPSESIFSI